MPPHQNAHALIPTTRECVMLHDKKDFTDVIKLTALQIGGLSWIIPVSPI